MVCNLELIFLFAKHSTDTPKVHELGKKVHFNKKIQSESVRIESVQYIFLSFLFLFCYLKFYCDREYSSTFNMFSYLDSTVCY